MEDRFDTFDSEDLSFRYIVGIDLGTTNSALAFVDRTKQGPEARRISFFDIPQLTAPGELGRRPILPSFLYLPGSFDLPPESTALPWDPSRNYTVGEFAREQGALVPGRLVSSAKSWLCHGGVDRTASILPWGSGTEVARVSPVEAASRYLQHMREAWNAYVARGREGFRLEEQLVVLTVPASFDEVARELTVTAARDAGLPGAVLIEEPLAAFYSWLSQHEENWRDGMRAGQIILVCDVGGGTTDFTIVAVREGEKASASTGSPWETTSCSAATTWTSPWQDSSKSSSSESPANSIPKSGISSGINAVRPRKSSWGETTLPRTARTT
jgi:molecular chaperone DnaK (HSP70)